MKKVVVLSGAGISAESGIKTFRDSGGLWEEYDIYEVATPEAWEKDQELVLRFYNERREGVRKALPNEAHKALAKLEEKYDVTVVTQNIDDLHERGGSRKVLHLHGELMKARSCIDESLLYDLKDGKGIFIGDRCEKGSQLRPHVVWFGEAVPMFEKAVSIVSSADILIVVGTSLAVYPAAQLIYYAPKNAAKYLIDPKSPEGGIPPDIKFYKEKASYQVPKLVNELLKI